MSLLDQPLTQLSNEVQSQVCDLIVAGNYVKDAAAMCGLTAAKLARYRAQNADFDRAISRARRTAAELRVDEMDDIARTEPDVNRARLRVDVIKWRAGKEASHIYGDRVEVNVNQTVDIGAALTAARARVVRPVCDLPAVIDGEARVIASDTGTRPTDEQSTDADEGDDADTGASCAPAGEGDDADTGALG